MSLDCEGDGALCVECGEFDFLPYACPWCCGTFCAAHATCHHIPAHAAPTAPGAPSTLPLNKAAGDAAMSSSAPLCTPPQEALLTLTEAGTTLASSAPSALHQHRCVVCQSVLCALAPCPQCGDCYCAAHRFHGHEDIASKARQQRRANQRAVSFGQQDRNGATTVDPVAALCAPFTPAHPLVLAPVGYRSRRTDVLALIVAPATAAVTNLIGSAVGGTEAPTYTIGVCSLIVATEMSVGQLRDRLVGFLRDASAPAAKQDQDSEAAGWMLSWWSEWVSSAHATLFSVAPAATATDSAAVVGSTLRRVPALSLVQLPVDAILRKAPMTNATVLLSLTDAASADHTTSEERAALQRLMVTVLYGKATCLSAPSSSAAALSTSARTSAYRDDRVKALATRLYLQHQQLLRRTAAGAQETSVGAPDTAADKAEWRNSQPSEDRAGASAPETGMLPEPALDAEGDATLSSATVIDVAGNVTPLPAASVWPFRHAPPLNSFDFFNTKLSPCGASAIRPATAPRVVVAVFVADAAMPVALMPMCIALGRDWPLARVVDRLREEVGEQQMAQHRDAREALNTFSVYRLGSGSGAGSAAVGTEGGLACLWSGRARTPTSSTPVTLQNRDVLLLCPADLPGAEAAVKDELQRLRGLTGKARTALKADQMTKCVVM
ncbi:predicted zinc finger protein [Leishmania donovani]|uniref:Predicted_zinc_finger_protein/GeneDB:LmjF.25.0650 n=1 Tax=Leishmania donovani TaxID=5661 RepID=A0A6J8FD47_LEIDO|nr:predicted zinc finger protein [Leishmania donovani]VDZ45256.1 predicted_zinc_finger_protein/GeneDB:LmjF.25.0650 [Leishmania donovani]